MALEKAVMIFRVPQEVKKFFISWATSSFSQSMQSVSKTFKEEGAVSCIRIIGVNKRRLIPELSLFPKIMAGGGGGWPKLEFKFAVAPLSVHYVTY
jgi:hypothetical protein